jgi:hypothetical protein
MARALSPGGSVQPLQRPTCLQAAVEGKRNRPSLPKYDKRVSSMRYKYYVAYTFNEAAGVFGTGTEKISATEVVLDQPIMETSDILALQASLKRDLTRSLARIRSLTVISFSLMKTLT